MAIPSGQIKRNVSIADHLLPHRPDNSVDIPRLVAVDNTVIVGVDDKGRGTYRHLLPVGDIVAVGIADGWICPIDEALF